MKMEGQKDVDPIAAMQEAQLGFGADVNGIESVRHDADRTSARAEATRDSQEAAALADLIKNQLDASGSEELKEAPPVSWREGGPFLFGNMKPYDGPHDLPTTALVRHFFPEFSRRLDEWGHRMIDRAANYIASSRK